MILMAEERGHITRPVLHYNVQVRKQFLSKEMFAAFFLEFWTTEERNSVLLNWLVNG
jgi:hypothetical protein